LTLSEAATSSTFLVVTISVALPATQRVAVDSSIFGPLAGSVIVCGATL